MQIATGANLIKTGIRTAPAYQTSARAEGPSDSVTLGYNDAKDVALMAGAGFLPGVGAVANFMAMVGAGVNNKENLTWMNLAGAGANVAGTVSLAGGLIFGNPTASYVGLGLLGSSAVTAAITAAAL